MRSTVVFVIKLYELVAWVGGHGNGHRLVRSGKVVARDLTVHIILILDFVEVAYGKHPAEPLTVMVNLIAIVERYTQTVNFLRRIVPTICLFQCKVALCRASLKGSSILVHRGDSLSAKGELGQRRTPCKGFLLHSGKLEKL